MSSGFRSRLGVPWGWRAARVAPVSRVLTAPADPRPPAEPAETVVDPTKLQLVAQALPGADATKVLIHARVSTAPAPFPLGPGDVPKSHNSWSCLPKKPSRATSSVKASTSTRTPAVGHAAADSRRRIVVLAIDCSGSMAETAAVIEGATLTRLQLASICLQLTIQALGQ